jgi:hypothetical protein
LDHSRAGEPLRPRDHPTLGFLESHQLFEPAFLPIRTRYGFDDEQAPYAVAAAVALLILHCAKGLDPHKGFLSPPWGFIEGTKTAPDP